MIDEMKNLLMINPKRLCLGERNVMININKNKKRITVSILLVLLTTLTMILVSSSNAFATDYSFSFRVPPHCGNGQEKYGRYRGNVYPGNRWWVILSHSGEGKGSYTDFWLESKNGKNLSPYIRVKCGAGWYGQRAYESARSRTVYLTAENNRNTPRGYNVSGRWQPHE